MKKTLTALLSLTCLAGIGLLYIQPDQDHPGKLLGPNYWGSACELSTTGFVICLNHSKQQVDVCTTGKLKYRLQTTPGDPKGLPVTLEIWTPEADDVTKIVSERFFGEGTGLCYTEGYDFPQVSIRIDSGSSCIPATSDHELRAPMFYVDDSQDYLPCEIPESSEGF